MTVILLIPVGVDGGYSPNGYSVNLKIGFLNIHLLPSKKKPKKEKKKEKKKPKKQTEKEQEEEKKEKAPPDKDLILGLIRPGLDALSSFRKKLTINYLRLYLVIATDDPYGTATRYSYSQAMLGGIIPVLENLFNIKERDVGTGFDFLAEKSKFYIWINTTIQIWQILYIALVFGLKFLMLNRKLKKERKVRALNEEENSAESQTPEASETASKNSKIRHIVQKTP